MLVSGIVVFAALCGFAVVVQADPSVSVNLEKVTVTNRDNPVTGKWSATVTPADPVNKIALKAPLIADFPANTEVLFTIKINGKPLPDITSSACATLKDETIGKGVVAKGKPFPKDCPIKKGDYALEDYFPDNKSLPPGLPDGKLEATVQISIPGEEPMVLIELEGEISHAVPGMG